ncbi:hypothetical protein M3Y96_01029600 [Aphelenchoides besseyi]|nr:hypothetical protein M3Y96_01029600 [Aphelenchoides besseyi]
MNPNITAMAFVFNLLQANQTNGSSVKSLEVIVDKIDRLPSWGKPYQIEFLKGLPLNEIESFIDIQLNRTMARGDQETLLEKWAKKQGNEIEKQYRSFVSELNERQTTYLRERGNQICSEVRKELTRVYEDKEYSYRDVCEQFILLGEDFRFQILSVGEDSPLHEACSAHDNLSTEIENEDYSENLSTEDRENDKIDSTEDKSEQYEEKDNKTKKHEEFVF